MFKKLLITLACVTFIGAPSIPASAGLATPVITGSQPTGDNPTPGYRTPGGYPASSNVIGDTEGALSERNIDFADGGQATLEPMHGLAATGITALVTPEMIGQGSGADGAILPPGWDTTQAWPAGPLQRGHLLANNLGGLGTDARNLVTITNTANTEMRVIEDKVANTVRSGEDVEYTVTPRYRHGYNHPPTTILVTAEDVEGDLNIVATITDIP